MTARRIDHVGVTVSDLDRALAFYCGVLGLRHLGTSTLDDPDLAALLGLDGARVTIADLDSGDGRVVELIQYHAPASAAIAYASSSPASMHIALGVDDLDAARRRLDEAGATVISTQPLTITDPGGRWDGAICLYIRDPDGAILELVQRPRFDDTAPSG
jgi:catechol 2,3-dioxygenase-like lactoylglutathione lyase family enzyme